MSYTVTNTGVITFTQEMLEVKIFQTREEMGKEAAIDVSETIQQLLGGKDEINMIFAAAPSQSDFKRN